MTDVIDYTIVITHNGPNTLIREVNTHIKNGYEPQGGLVVDGKYWYQAMIKREGVRYGTQYDLVCEGCGKIKQKRTGFP